MHESSEMRMLTWMTRAETLGNISEEKHKSRCGKHRVGELRSEAEMVRISRGKDRTRSSLKS